VFSSCGAPKPSLILDLTNDVLYGRAVTVKIVQFLSFYRKERKELNL
jgi:hypothetical protein